MQALPLLVIAILVPLGIRFSLQSSPSNIDRVRKIISVLLVILLGTALIPFHPINGDNSSYYSVVDFVLRKLHPGFTLMLIFYSLTVLLLLKRRYYMLTFLLFLGGFASSMYAVFTGDIGRSEFILKNYPNQIYWIATGIPLVYFILPQLVFFSFVTLLRYVYAPKWKHRTSK